MDNIIISLNDLSALLHNPIAIRCATAEEAMELVVAFTKQFPDHISGVSVEDTYWDEYEEDANGNLIRGINYDENGNEMAFNECL